MKKGLSIIGKILLFAFILLIGMGTYTAYLFYTDPGFDLLGLRPVINDLLGIEAKKMPGLPDELQKYAVGEDADMVLIFKMDDLPELGEEFAQLELINKLDTILVLGKGCDNCIFGSKLSAAALFETEEAANTFKTTYDEDSTIGLIFARYKSGIDGKVVLISNSTEPFEDYNGRLADNPGILKISGENLKSNLVFYVDNTRVPEFSVVMFSLINTIASGMPYNSNLDASLPNAHAQGLISPSDQPARIAEASGGSGNLRQTFFTLTNLALSSARNVHGYVDFKEGKINLEISVTISTLEEIKNLPAIKMSMQDVTDEQIESVYKQTISSLKEMSTEIDTKVTDLKTEYPELEMKLKIDDKQIDLSMSFAVESFAPNGRNPGDAPSRARDAARLANLNTIIVAIETYYADSGSYPQKTACVRDMAELQNYFVKGESPSDDSGARTFETQDGTLNITCEDGFLYQYFDNDEYILWAEMENATSGKMEYLLTDKSDFIMGTEGRYFTFGSVDPTTTGEMSPYEGMKKTTTIEDKTPPATVTNPASKGVSRIKS